MTCLLFPALSQGARPGDSPINRPYFDMKPWHLGFAIGMHFQDLSLSSNGYQTPEGGCWLASVPTFAPGFNINIMGQVRLHRYLALRFSPGLMFGSKDVRFREHITGVETHQDIKSTYITLPLDLKISGDRLRNVRPYLTVGAGINLDIGKRRPDPLQFNTADGMISIGLGTDFYLPYFKLNPELKFCFGLTDILRHSRPELEDDPLTAVYTRSLAKVKSNFVVLSFYFE